MNFLSLRALTACVLALLCELCLAQHSECDSGQLSHAAEAECLRKEYRGIDRLLLQKMEQLIGMAEPADMLTAPRAERDAKRKQIQDAVRRADVL